MKRLFSVLIAAALTLTALPFASMASADATVSQKAADLEAKYGIRIEYAASSLSEGNLDTLDMALANLTPAAVRQVSAYYQAKNGNPITISYLRQSSRSDNRLDLASFDKGTSKIEFYLSGKSEAGDNPISIVHEFGHAIHGMYTDSYGADKMQREWLAFNDGNSYSAENIMKNPNDRVFISPYAATQYGEDVAEVIGHAFIRYRAGQGFTGKLSQNGTQTGLGRKLAYVEQMLASCITDSDAMIANLRRTYSAATTYTYQSMKFSGDYMQYAGYPQPKLVLKSVLGSMGVQRSKAAWIREMGAWYVRTTNGAHLIVFPGGAWSEPGSSFSPPI